MTTQPRPQTDHPDQRTPCAYCGHGILAEAPTYERFGERFCSAEHAEAFAEGVRAQRIAAVAVASGLVNDAMSKMVSFCMVSRNGSATSRPKALW